MTPADAAKKILGVEPTGEDEEASFSDLVHWSYGTAWGAVRGVLGEVGLSGKAATTAHLAVVWGFEQAVLPKLDVAPPVWEWGGEGHGHRPLPPSRLRDGHRPRLRAARPLGPLGKGGAKGRVNMTDQQTKQPAGSAPNVPWRDLLEAAQGEAVEATKGDPSREPEAMYWRAVLAFEVSEDRVDLTSNWEKHLDKFPESDWAKKAGYIR